MVSDKSFSKEIVRVFRMLQNKERQERSYLGLFIQEIQRVQSAFDKCIFRFTPRSGNRVADSLAHLAHSDPNVVWIEEVPPAINDVFMILYTPFFYLKKKTEVQWYYKITYQILT